MVLKVVNIYIFSKLNVGNFVINNEWMCEVYFVLLEVIFY